MTSTDRKPSFVVWAASACAFASGASALVYEVLWLKELGLLFGNTAHASATGLAVFFAGMAAGSRFGSARAGVTRRPLATYARLEVGIAITALPFFWLMDAYRAIYGPLYAMAGPTATLSTLFFAVKIGLAALALFPPAFCIGATLPLLGQAAIGGPHELGRHGAWLYALNTLGAAAGAFAAGFYLPAAVGFRRACLLAVALNLSIALGAWLLARRVPSALEEAVTRAPRAPVPRRPTASGAVLAALAATSGFLTLALEVATTRLFAQVLQNSVYTFSAILVVFLLALGIGAFLASRLTRPMRTSGWPWLACVAALAGVAVATLPTIFHIVTDGLGYVAAGEGWTGYVVSVFTIAAVVLGPACVIAGLLFPLLLHLAPSDGPSPGAIIGRLGSWNTIGSIGGSIGTGFLLLPHAGLRMTFTVIAAAYVLVATMVLLRFARAPMATLAVAALGLGTIGVVSPTRLPLLRIDPASSERVLEIRESVYGVTSVVDRAGDRMIKVNNFYSLGGSASLEHERNQVLLPLLTHPDPRAIFILGLGTGITAGAAVQPPVERLVVAELIPDVVRASQAHFREVTNRLFDDPRVEIVATDGRNHLAGVRETFDLVVADLFVPWESGAGSLYTREHFDVVRQRLSSNGVFVQWLPLYQMSRTEFMTVARTMLDVFTDVTVWRGDFFPEGPIVALAGAVALPPLDPTIVAVRGSEVAGRPVPPEAVRALTLPFYAGHLSAARHLVPPGPLNLDDRPVLEYAAPITHREQRTGAARWFTSVELIAFFEQLLNAVPPERDPYLSRLDEPSLAWIRSGFHRHASAVYRRTGDDRLSAQHAAQFEATVPPAFRRRHEDEPAERRGDW